MTKPHRKGSGARLLERTFQGMDAVMTQEEVARALGVTRARIVQLERSAMSKLRRYLHLDERTGRERTGT